MIDAPTRDFLGDFLRRTAVRERAEIVAIAILQTHVHVVLRSGPRVDLSRLVQLMKGGSSYAASRVTGNRLGLRWAKEYFGDDGESQALDESGRNISRRRISTTPVRGSYAKRVVPTLTRRLANHKR